jgi:SAM-dependent methyltransferase
MDFDVLAATWDAEHGPSSARAVEFAACLAILRSTCQQFPRPRVLDVGCGTGLHLLALANHISEGVGVDLSEAMVERARKKVEGVDACLRFTMAPAEELSTEALGWFDLVFLVGSLEHMLDPACVLTRVSVVLAPDGEVVVIMRNPLHPSTLFRRLTGRSKVLPRYRHMTPRELANVAERSGLKLVRLMSVVATSQDLRAGDLAATPWHSALGVRWHRIYAAHLVHRKATGEA